MLTISIMPNAKGTILEKTKMAIVTLLLDAIYMFPIITHYTNS
jgi:hypothetical protein